MTYDNAGWHDGSGTHIALFLRWCFTKGWAGELHLEHEPKDTQRVIEGTLSATDYFTKYCDGKLTNEDFNAEGNAFAGKYYGKDGLFLDDYAKTFKGLVYAAPEKDRDFAKFSAMCEARLKSDILTRRQLPRRWPGDPKQLRGAGLLIGFGLIVSFAVAYLGARLQLSAKAMENLLISAVTGSIVALLGGLNFVAELARLKKKGIPRPLFVIFERVVAPLLPLPGVAAERLKGRLALVSWDVRWISAGETLATVVDCAPERSELTLELDEPLDFGDTTRQTVTFRGHWPAAFGRRSVQGHFEPEIAPGLKATGSVVVYPERREGR